MGTHHQFGLMLAIMVMVWMAACTKPKDASTLAADSGTTTLRMSYWGSIEEIAITEQAIKRFEQANPGIKIKAEHIGQDYMAKLMTELAAGHAPDIIFVERTYIKQLSDKDVLLDLLPYIAREPGFPVADFRENIWNNFKAGDKVLGIPRDVGTIVLYYNKKLFREAGLPTPPMKWDDPGWTWEAFLKTAQTLTRDNDKDGRIDQYGVVFNYWTDMWTPWVYQNGGQVMNENLTQCLMSDPHTVEAIQFLADMSIKYKVAPTPQQFGNMGTDAIQAFEMNKAAMYPTGFWLVTEFNKMKNLEWDVAPLPHGKQPATTWHGSAFAIWKGSRHPKACWKFLKFNADEETQRAMARSGLLIPSRKSIADTLVQMKGQGMPEHVGVFLDGFNYAKQVTNLTDSPELNDQVNLMLDSAWNGLEPVPQVCQKITQRINEDLHKPAKAGR